MARKPIGCRGTRLPGPYRTGTPPDGGGKAISEILSVRSRIWGLRGKAGPGASGEGANLNVTSTRPLVLAFPHAPQSAPRGLSITNRHVPSGWRRTTSTFFPVNVTGLPSGPLVVALHVPRDMARFPSALWIALILGRGRAARAERARVLDADSAATALTAPTNFPVRLAAVGTGRARLPETEHRDQGDQKHRQATNQLGAWDHRASSVGAEVPRPFRNEPVAGRARGEHTGTQTGTSFHLLRGSAPRDVSFVGILPSADHGRCEGDRRSAARFGRADDSHDAHDVSRAAREIRNQFRDLRSRSVWRSSRRPASDASRADSPPPTGSPAAGTRPRRRRRSPCRRAVWREAARSEVHPSAPEAIV
jgi:hypothetical protein